MRSDESSVKEMKTVRTGTVKSRIKRGDQVVFIAGKEYNRYDSAGKRQPYRGTVIEVDARNGQGQGRRGDDR